MADSEESAMPIGEDGSIITAAQPDTSLPEPLLLPDVEEMALASDGLPRLGNSAFYGAAHVAAAYCGFKDVPGHLRGCWQHGWTASYRMPIPPDLILGTWASPDNYYWVARKDEEECLRSAGLPHVAAIGMPIVYLPPRPIRRRPNSLLVMPAHTLEYVTCSWKFDEYAEAIAAIRHEFSEVVVCISPSCWKHGYWVDAFRTRGFRLVAGANLSDRNALERVRYLLSSFEYMATNSFGSQLAYAPYFGAKPSVYGPYAARRAEDFTNDPRYRRNPEWLEIVLKATSEEELRRHYPHLFCHPREARADVEWARFELGEANKVSPRTMRSLFGWTAGARAARKLHAKTPKSIKHWARILSRPSYRKQFREMRRLWAMPSFEPTTTELLGHNFEVRDVPRFLETKSAVFDGDLYRFTTTEDIPRIIDCGASVGLFVCYFKHLYPKSDVVAFEPDPNVFEVLKRNCTSWGADDILLIRKAVWIRESTLPFRGDGKWSSRVDEEATGDDVPRVPTCRLRDYLTQRVDLLRLDIEGAEVDVLLDCADVLGQVQNLAVDYHSIFKRPQRLDELMALLTRAGFRMHFRATRHSWSPFVFRPLQGKIDCQLHIFAYRE
jgi:FkbM family methyltransferase